jgi:predicted anti-sigma-YlaC factor YlaD
MRRAFDIAMRLVSSLLGLVMIAVGSVWMLQGLNLAFRVGFMVGDKHWTAVGHCAGVLEQLAPRAQLASVPTGPPGTGHSATSN